MFNRHNILAVLNGVGTAALVFGFLAGFMILNGLHWGGAL